MIKLKKIPILIAENFYNLSIYEIIKILLILYNTYIIFRDQDKFVFYVNSYINQNQFNQLYDPDWINKDIRNINIVACKFGPVLTRAMNYRLKVASKKRKKREEIIERQKTKTVATKH